jgi:hypothetical protein
MLRVPFFSRRMTSLLISCEHATCAVPEAYRDLFRGSEEVVASAEGWRPGSLNLAQGMAIRFRTPLVHGDVTRLLIDLEEDGDARWSRFSSTLPESSRAKLVDRHERPYRALLKQRVGEDLRRHDEVLHVFVHTGAVPDGSVILANAQGCARSEALANAWGDLLRSPGLSLQRQRPERLRPLVEDMRGAFPDERYAPVRLEVAEGFFLNGSPWKWEDLKKHLYGTLATVLAG